MTSEYIDELDLFFRTYREAYTNLDLDEIFAHYTVPLLSVTGDEQFWMTSREDVESVMSAYLDLLRRRDYDRGELEGVRYHALSEVDVLASTTWTRYTTADEVLERLGTTYLLRRTDDGWKISVIVLHDPETAIV